MVNGIISLISLSDLLLLVYRNAFFTSFSYLIAVARNLIVFNTNGCELFMCFAPVVFFCFSSFTVIFFFVYDCVHPKIRSLQDLSSPTRGTTVKAPTVKAQSSNHWTSGKFPFVIYF